MSTKIKDNFFNFFLGELGVKRAVQEVREITVKAFNSRDQLIGKCEFGYKPTLLEPKYCVDSTGEEDSVDTGKGKKVLHECFGCIDPSKSPLGLTHSASDRLDCTKKAQFCDRVLDLGLAEEVVHLGVNVLDGDPESVEGVGLGKLTSHMKQLTRF
ncbi:hypothetical protein HPP92_024436 [Vanilla planifolia]|uniref:Uncharacterized protein n=1 Tax=Vanilla planifolia TaxID=51239 RepID=A0A835PST1_VANPL|nr:hypothetical protein HPP92_024436 [Vanilla planifolia]